MEPSGGNDLLLTLFCSPEPEPEPQPQPQVVGRFVMTPGASPTPGTPSSRFSVTPAAAAPPPPEAKPPPPPVRAGAKGGGERSCDDRDGTEEAAAARISLSLTENYAPSWGAWEGVREFVQNWHDGVINSAGGAAIGTAIVESHGASVHYVATAAGSGAELGVVEYDAPTEKLTLVNRNVALARRVLLLGHSVKAQHADVAGQFGEGMKVGALALLREGRSVTMQTSQETWSWARATDPMFGVRVLTIFVSPRDKAGAEGETRAQRELGPDDTCTVISSVSAEEWRTFKRRFLWLERPKDSYSCVVGTLLLDERLAGDLFVKGIWIADHSKDGLRTGVDLREIRLDRDRRSVAHPSDVEQQASALWVRAVEARPDLVQTLYEMLAEESPPPEVRHAAEYLQSDRYTNCAQLVAQAFFGQHGTSALPLASGAVTHNMLSEISTRLNSTAVVVNSALMAVLRRSGLVGDAAAMLAQAQVDAKEILTLEEVDRRGELGVLRSAIALARQAADDERLELSQVDVVANHSAAECMADTSSWGTQLEISAELLDIGHAHASLGGICANNNACRCREVAVASALLACVGAPVHAERRGWAAAAGAEQLHAEPVAEAAPVLPAQAHEFSEREHVLREQLQAVSVAAERKDLANATELGRLKEDLKQVEQTIMEEEVKRVNQLSQARDIVAPELDELRRQFEQERARSAELSQQVVSLQIAARHSASTIADTDAQLERERCGHLRHVRATEAHNARQRGDLRRKSEEIAAVMAGGGSTTDEATEALLLVISDLRKEVEAQEARCIVCFDAPQDAVFLPCRHGGTCLACARKLQRCPLCRTTIDECMQVFR
jgi:hypothetical protein